jgi:hypothetical protein
VGEVEGINRGARGWWKRMRWRKRRMAKG